MPLPTLFSLWASTSKEIVRKAEPEYQLPEEEVWVFRLGAEKPPGDLKHFPVHIFA